MAGCAVVYSLEFHTAIGTLTDVESYLGITLRTHRYLGVRVNQQTALGALGGIFGNGSRARRTNAL
jgi:hypothetical protein